MKQTKAEKIFKDTYYECLHHVRTWGLEYNTNGKPVAYGSLITEQAVSIRTCNDVRKYMNAENKRLDMNEKYGIRTAAEQTTRRDALKMVEATLENQIESIRKFEAELKAI